MTVNPPNVPTEVIFGCAAVNNVPPRLVAENAVDSTLPNEPVEVNELLTLPVAVRVVNVPAAAVDAPIVNPSMVAEPPNPVDVTKDFPLAAVIVTLVNPVIVVTFG